MKPLSIAATQKKRYLQLLENITSDDTVGIMINADPDALASALSVKRLLRYRVKSVTIVYPNEIRRLSNIAMVDLPESTAVNMPIIYENIVRVDTTQGLDGIMNQLDSTSSIVFFKRKDGSYRIASFEK